MGMVRVLSCPVPATLTGRAGVAVGGAARTAGARVPPTRPAERNERRWASIINITKKPGRNISLGMSRLKFATVAAVVAAALMLYRRRRGPPEHTDEA